MKKNDGKTYGTRDLFSQNLDVPPEKGSRENPYAISELNRKIKIELEYRYPKIWLIGEISNFVSHTSGHYYFSLKDSGGQIQAAMFHQQNRRLKFRPEEGLEVLACGRLSIYPPRGTFQIIIEEMEPKGIGSLQFAFEQLKKKLETEGLFDETRKMAIPSLPRTVGIVTSPTGAAIRDILKILQRINIRILLYPSKVQGEEAAQEIVEGIRTLGSMKEIDLIIIGRGGGSMEDLWSFNEEIVARAMADCRIPIISAVGHEIDFTISDFVADLRAPTPSAAAAMIVQKRLELEELLNKYVREIIREGKIFIQERAERLIHLERSRGFIGMEAFINEREQRIDELGRRMFLSLHANMKTAREVFRHLYERVSPMKIGMMLESALQTLHRLKRELGVSIMNQMRAASDRVSRMTELLNSLSPLAILERGYAIVRTPETKKIIRRITDVSIGEDIDVKLHKGSLLCNVKSKEEGKKDEKTENKEGRT